MMKKLILMLLLSLSIVPVSIIVMMYGWGVLPQNWGWIAFGYLWMGVVPAVIEVLK